MFFYKKIYLGKKIDDYTLEKLLGEGRYGICFLAKRNNNEKVVIKKFKTNFLGTPNNQHIAEAVILSRLNDSRIPKLLGVINKKKFYAYVLEFKDGSTIKELLFNSNHIFSNQEIFNIGIKLLDIIKYLHSNNIIHGDIGISNIIIKNDNISLIDFGLAQNLEKNSIHCNIDFSYFGDFLLYLIYSSFKPGKTFKKLSWYNELPIDSHQKLFIKKLLGLEKNYIDINEVYSEFIKYFNINNKKKEVTYE